MLRAAAVAAGLIFLAAACSDDDGGGSGAGSTSAATASSTTAPGAAVAIPELDGPISGGTYSVPYNPIPPEVAEEHGYVEEEYFVSGEATSYAATGDLGADGQWSVVADDTAPYTTRIVVRRPEDPAAFNGIVVVEWLNVTAGRDSDPDFGSLYPLLLDEGYAYVAVSAQAAGIESGGAFLEVPGVPPESLAPLKDWDPERYESLSHPGDEYAFDIFSQAAQAVRRPGDLDPLDGLDVTHVIAAGQSQSASALATYVNGVQPEAGIYDGFLVHGRGDGGLALNADPADATPDVLAIRTDLDQPVLQFETETDVARGFEAARQDDSDSVVSWEVAGTAHADRGTLDYGVFSGQVWSPGTDLDIEAECGVINDGPQAEVVRAGFDALAAWVTDGTAPPRTPRIEIEGGVVARDATGLALGGARTPAVDAPTEALTGVTPSDSVFCSLFGGGEPLPAADLAGLYESHEDYVAQVTASADAAVTEGWLLPADRDAMVDDAEAADIP
jgi:hypothetical protein